MKKKTDSKIKIITTHPQIKKYQKKMRKEGRCEQCIFPWCDGLCECGKLWSDKDREELEDITNLAYKLLNSGWKDKDY